MIFTDYNSTVLDDAEYANSDYAPPAARTQYYAHASADYTVHDGALLDMEDHVRHFKYDELDRNCYLCTHPSVTVQRALFADYRRNHVAHCPYCIGRDLTSTLVTPCDITLGI